MPGASTTTGFLVTASMLASQGGAMNPLVAPVLLESRVIASAPVTHRALEIPASAISQARAGRGKGTSTFPTSAVDDLDVPATALLAYQRAAGVVGQVDQSCGLSWTLLAAIGQVETDHGRLGGARLRPDGTSSRAIPGPSLDGAGQLARIPDTDGGRLDGDIVWDRAVGPMQFLPSTWAVVGVDADGDSVRSPDDLDDAALAAAVFLCSGSGDLTTRSGRRTAVHRYNPSAPYVASVLSVERAYRAGAFDTPGQVSLDDSYEIVVLRSDPTGRAQPDAARVDDKDAIRAAAVPLQHGHGGGPNTHLSTSSDPPVADDPGADPTDDPGTAPAPGPTGTPDPTIPPAPAPAPHPDPVELIGVLSACGAGWCLDDLSLDVGEPDLLSAASRADFDADGAVESNAEELAGLAGTEVSVLVDRDTAPALVLALNGVVYRTA